MNANQTTQPQATSHPITERQFLEREAKRRYADTLEACRRAVECMESFAADARRKYERALQADAAPRDLVDLPCEVMAASCWAAANVSSQINIATQRLAEYLRAVGNLESGSSGR